MRFIQRDLTGAITGDYANPQSGYAEEAMNESVPEFMAWKEKQNTPQPKALDVKALLRALIKKGVLSKAEADAEIGK